MATVEVYGVMQITVDSRLQEVKIIVIGTVSRLESVPSSDSWKESIRMRLSFYYWNTKRMLMIHTCLHGMAVPSCKCHGRQV